MSTIIGHSKNQIRIIIGILVLFHSIGIALMIFTDDGAQLSYLNLLLCGLLLFISESGRVKTGMTFFLIFSGGFLVEYIGVHTGLLFGNYEYGNALGPKLAGIPLVIGVNWICIVVASSSLISTWRLNILIKSMLAGLLCTALDFIIEPVAIKLDFWSWEGGIIPIWNYTCWFAFSSLFALIYLRFNVQKNKPAQSLYLIWILFFSILNFVI